jgi:outer membrane receptor protein involved in Fe transport
LGADAAVVPLYAVVFGSIHGLVHDPQHRPVSGAQVTVRASNADWQRTLVTNDMGEFRLDAIPAGAYSIEVSAAGFGSLAVAATVVSGSVTDLHFPLEIASVQQSVEVSGEAPQANIASSSPPVQLGREQIARTPGADRANSLAMITDYVPGAVVVHDQLHIRGGHQYTWLLDGIPVPNTNIASNIGPQFDPKDIDYLEVQSGGLSAEYGDRAYGVLNVVTRSGFERHNEGEIVAGYGSFNQSNDQFSLGSHTDRFAYYTSLGVNRTDLGLETPTPEVIHDFASGVSGFASLIFNHTPSDQMRAVISARGDHFQVPNTPEQQADGIRDIDHERDVFVSTSWVHTGGGMMLTASPFYHFNSARYQGGKNDTPVVPDDDRRSHYAGGVLSLAVDRGRHNARIGMQGFAQHDFRALSLLDRGDGSAPPTQLAESQQLWGSLLGLFAEEQFKISDRFWVSAGVRWTRFSGALVESSTDPRLGASLRLPRLNWTLHASYGRYYQAPPLFSVGGPVLELAANQGFGFLPLKGERDEQHEFGVTIPFRGWQADLREFRTAARNFFDHDALGNSNIFFPLTIARARIHGWEASVRSPRIAKSVQLHLAYSRQWVQGSGGITGGMTDFAVPDEGFYYLDHDQRDTLSTGAQINLPRRTWAATNVSYGSGFLQGDGPDHLPAHTTVDLSLGHSFGERWSAQASALNLTNRRYLLDLSNTFGGTHYSNARELMVEVRYRFKY